MSRQTTKSTTSPSNPVNSISSTATATPPGRTTARKPTPEQIRKRAYEFYLARRGQGGSPEQDWLKAERDLNTNG